MDHIVLKRIECLTWHFQLREIEEAPKIFIRKVISSDDSMSSEAAMCRAGCHTMSQMCAYLYGRDVMAR